MNSDTYMIVVKFTGVLWLQCLMQISCEAAEETKIVLVQFQPSMHFLTNKQPLEKIWTVFYSLVNNKKITVLFHTPRNYCI